MSAETEANGTYATADSISSGTQIKGQIYSSTDLDVFAIDATAAGSLEVSFDTPTNSSYTDYFAVYLYDSAGNVIGGQNTGDDISFTAGIEAAGTYYAAVSSSTYHNSEEYGLTVTTSNTIGGAETEANGTYATADSISSGTQIKGQIYSSTDLDVFAIDATAAGSLEVSFDTPTNSSYTDYFAVYLYDSAGNVIGGQNTGDDISFTAGIEAAGTYYAAVSSSTYHNSEEYGLTVTTSNTIGGAETEANGTYATADSISSGTQIKGQIYSSTDLDVFAIDATAAGSLEVSFDTPTNSSYTDYFAVYLYDSAGNVIGGQNTGDDISFTAGIEAAGTYYAAVSSSTYHNSEEYGLTVTTSNTIGGAETEANGTYATADSISSGTQIKGQIYSSTDLDVFAIDATAAGSLEVSFDTPTNSSYTDYFAVYLYDSAGNAIGGQNTGDDISFTAGIEAAGTYYAAVSSSTYHNSEEYGLTVTTSNTIGGAETEANGTYATADSISSGTQIKGQIYSSTDLDVFAIDATAAGSLEVSFDTPTNSSYTDYFAVYLYDSAGNVIGGQNTGDDISFTAGIEAAGTYYAAVSSSTYHNSEEYGLTVTTSNTIGRYETEPNGYGNYGDLLTAGKQMYGQLHSSSDVDWFYINAYQTGFATVTFDSPTNSSYSDYFNIEVRDADFNHLVSTKTGKDTDISGTITDTGIYWIGVSTAGYLHNDGMYSISADLALTTAVRETEDNDTYFDANMLTSGQTIIGQLSDAQDFDTFKIEASSSGDFSITFDAPTNDSINDYFGITLYDDAGNFIANQFTGNDTNFTTSFSNSGTYYLGIYSLNGYYNSEDYNLTVTYGATLESRETELNNTSSEADSITLGESISGQLLDAYDYDYYKFSLSSESLVSVELSSSINSKNIDYLGINLFNSDGDVIESFETGKDINFNTNLTEVGTYFLEVFTPGNFHTDEDYQIKVSTIDAVDDGDTRNIIKGSKFNDNLIGTSEQDLFSYTGGNDIIYGGAETDEIFIEKASHSEFELKNINGVFSLKSLGSAEYGKVILRGMEVESFTWGGETASIASLNTDISRSQITFGTTLGDLIIGSETDEIFDGLGGDDFINGEGGSDKVIIFENKTNITMETVGGMFRISSSDSGSEYNTSPTKFINIENLQFLNETVELTSSNISNVILKTTNNDIIKGSASDELIDGGGGNDTIDGGLGDDKVIFFTSSNDATTNIDYEKNIVEVAFNEDAQSEYVNSTVILTNIEEIQFLDDLIIIRKTEPVTTTLSASDIIENGNTVTLSLALDSAPTSSVAITLSAVGLSFSSSELTFGTANWGTPQTITLSLANDDTFQRTETIDINVLSDSSDPAFNFEINAIKQITRIDDDTATELDFISGTIWDDNNSNKTQDFGEEGLADIRVFLDANANGTYESSEKSTITDNLGQYILSDLDNDNYAVGIVPDFGWEYTYPYESGKKGLVTKKDDKKIEHDGPFYEVLSSDTGSDGFSYNFRDVLDDEYKSLTGAGQTVVVIDTGIDLDHPHFGIDNNNNGVSDRIIFSKTFGSGKANGVDDNGHGTHVAGTIASSDITYSGLAPGANIIALSALNSGGGLGKALSWCITNAEKYSIDAINMSLGIPTVFFQTENSYYLSEYFGFDDEFDALEDLGIISVASAGNGYEKKQSDYQHYTVNGSGENDVYEHRNEFEHSTQGISSPAAYENTISVGATEYGRGNYGSITSFSQRDNDLIDVFAPGGAITAAKNGGGTVAMSGTSMASPYMTGVVLLMQEAAEKTIDRKLTTDEIQKIISENSIEIYDGDDEDYTIASSSREYYNFVDPNAYIDAIISLGDPKFHYADLTSGYQEYNFGLINSDSEAFSDDSENIVIRNSNLSTFALGGDDNVYGTNESDNINGGAGDDVITGNEGDDTLTGGEGSDQIDGGKGIDTVIIDNDFSELTINYSNKFVSISNRFDTDSYTNIEQFQFSDQTLTKSQTLNAAGYSFIEDTSEDDVLTGTTNVDEISSKVGEDVINTHAGNDNINIDGTTYHDGKFAHNVGSITQVATEVYLNLAGKVKIETVVDGGADSDSIYLGNESDAFFLHDSFSGFHSSLILIKDTHTQNESTQRIINVENIYGLGGDDIIDLTSPDYSLAGQIITINGGNGEDIIWGSDATETLIGGNGNDVLFGGSGNDTLIGGSGADTFEFTVTSGNDTISDYSKSQGDILKIYRRDQYEGDQEATISAGVVTFGSVTIDLGDTSLTSLDLLNVEYAII